MRFAAQAMRCDCRNTRRCPKVAATNVVAAFTTHRGGRPISGTECLLHARLAAATRWCRGEPTRPLAQHWHSYYRNLNRGIKTMMNNSFGGIFGVLILVGDIWAVINIFQSTASNEKKLIWIVAVVLLPLLGLALWFFLGPRAGKSG